MLPVELNRGRGVRPYWAGQTVRFGQGVDEDERASDGGGGRGAGGGAGWGGEDPLDALNGANLSARDVAFQRTRSLVGNDG
jgi:hypothetical protein